MKYTAALVLLFTTIHSFAWGPVGHQVVAQIADDHLLPQAKAEIAKLLPKTKLSEIATWADEAKQHPEWAHTKPWHFVNIPDGGDYSQIRHSAEGDVITAITEMVQTLQNKSASSQDKANAVKFLVHFVGDIHQPLHTGKIDDEGGNQVKLNFNGRQTNLHMLWDSGIIDTEKLDYRAYSTKLEAQKASYDLPNFSFSQIVKEDMDCRKAVYSFKTESNGTITIDQTYVNANMATLHSRLLMGGMRLAELLNSIFAK